MIRSFRHKGLALLFAKGKTFGVRADHAQRLRIVLARLHAATSARDMDLPGLRLHPLKGQRAGFFSVSISGNWRVVFRFDGTDAIDVDYLDYH